MHFKVFSPLGERVTIKICDQLFSVPSLPGARLLGSRGSRPLPKGLTMEPRAGGLSIPGSSSQINKHVAHFKLATNDTNVFRQN